MTLGLAAVFTIHSFIFKKRILSISKPYAPYCAALEKRPIG